MLYRLGFIQISFSYRLKGCQKAFYKRSLARPLKSGTQTKFFLDMVLYQCSYMCVDWHCYLHFWTTTKESANTCICACVSIAKKEISCEHIKMHFQGLKTYLKPVNQGYMCSRYTSERVYILTHVLVKTTSVERWSFYVLNVWYVCFMCPSCTKYMWYDHKLW